MSHQTFTPTESLVKRLRIASDDVLRSRIRGVIALRPTQTHKDKRNDYRRKPKHFRGWEE